MKHLSVHQWLRSAIPDSQQPTSPIGFLFLKLPPPPCAVLLVSICPLHTSTLYTQMYLSIHIYTCSYVQRFFSDSYCIRSFVELACLHGWGRSGCTANPFTSASEGRDGFHSCGFCMVLSGGISPWQFDGEIRWGKWWLALISHCIWKYPNFDACTLPTTSSRSMI